MTTHYFVDGAGNYLGAYTDSTPPQEATEVETAPDDARQIWVFGNGWSAPPPPPHPVISPRQWLDRLPLDKQAAIFVAAAANAQLLGLVIYATGGPTMDPTDPRTAQGVNAFVGAGVLTEEDGALLLAP